MGRFSAHFGRAERYQREEPDADERQRRARAGLERVAQIGNEAERRVTGEELLEGLRTERERQGRPF